MAIRIRTSYVALLVVLSCATVITGLTLWRLQRDATVADLMARLPREDSVKLYVNLAALRASGVLDLLAGTGAEEEVEYREFVNEIGFNYRTDLDELVAAFHAGDTMFLARGRFSWRKLFGYARQSGGICINGFCRVPGSVSGRRISFFAVTPRVLALASSSDQWTALVMEQKHDQPAVSEIPAAPVWLMASGRALARSNWIPTGAKSFVSAVEGAENIVLAIQEDATDFQATLTVDCQTAERAAQLRGELTNLTELLGSLIRRQNQEPNPRDLSGVLTQGSFQATGNRVTGKWPIGWEFLRAVTGNG